MKKALEDINTAIKQAVQETWKTADVKTYALAESVTVRADEETTFPALVLPRGECIEVFSRTDKHDATLYHRLTGISYQEDADASFGSGKAYAKTADLAIIVFGKRDKIDQFELEGLIDNVLASNKDCTIVSSDFNSLQIFATEYAGISYFMGSAYFLFKINYRLTSTYNARCAK